MNDNPDASKKDALQEARKQITSSLFLALAAIGVIVFACYAWFVNNSNVSGTQVSVSASGSRFELASVGDEGIFDNRLPDADKVEGSVWEKYSGGRITNSDRTILWRVSKDSNLGNDSGFGIEPGKDGTLQFYVVPQGVDSLDLTFTLEIIPLEIQTEKFVPIDNDVAKTFLKGHLLVHYQKKGESNSTLVNPSFNLTVGADPVLVSLDWSWPYLLEDAIEDNEVKSLVNTSPELFLCEQLDPYVKVVEAPFTLPEKSNPEFRKYSNFYNNADQYIGTNVKAILFRLTAIEG